MTTHRTPPAGQAGGVTGDHERAKARVTTSIAHRGHGGKGRAHRESEVRDLGAGNWNVESKSSPGTMHLVRLAVGRCDCPAITDWHRATCRHLAIARAAQERKDEAAIVVALMVLVGDHGPERVARVLRERYPELLPAPAASDYERRQTALIAASYGDVGVYGPTAEVE